jgi:plasmid stabilization system protein ParE
MSDQIVLAARARRQVAQIVKRYEAERRDLGIHFLHVLVAKFSLMAEYPSMFTEVRPRIRRAVLTRFPYSVFFTERSEQIVVLAVLHHARNPKRWPR